MTLPVAHSEREQLAVRMRTVRVGALITATMLAAVLTYALLTWGSPHRVALLLLGLAAGVVALLVWQVAHRRPAGSGRDDLLLAGWNVTSLAFAATGASLDGGPESPLVAVLFVSVVFAAVSLPRRAVVVIAALDVGALLVLAATAAQWPPKLVVWVVALISAAAAGEDIAADRWRRALALQRAGEELYQRLARVVEYRDDDTGSHMARIGESCKTIALALGWAPAAAEELGCAAIMHDIGKVAIPDRILCKRGPLTPREREVMQQHTLVGDRMLAGSAEPILQLAARIALTHHERWDGQGYPHGLRCEEIPLVGRIVAVADVFDALTSDRVYRPAMSRAQALALIESERGRHFDPAVVDAFLAQVRGGDPAGRALVP